MGCEQSGEDQEQAQRQAMQNAKEVHEVRKVEKRVEADISTGTLYYFPLHFRAGPIRMMLKHKGVAYEDKRITQEEWPARKAEFPGGAMPAWIDKDKPDVMLCQSMAILKYLGFVHGYMADEEMSNFRQEFCFECWNDFEQGGTWKVALQPEVSEEEVAAFDAGVCKLMDRLEEMFAMADLTRHLCHYKLTIADFLIFSHMSSFVGNDANTKVAMKDCVAKNLESHANVKKWFDLMCEENKAYLEGRTASPL